MAPSLRILLLLHASVLGVDARTCKGGDQASCECLLSCGTVFGADPSKCKEADDPNEVVDQMVGKALQLPGNECDLVGCVVTCSKKLDCLNDNIVEKCARVKSEYPHCKTNCNAAGWGASPLGAGRQLLFSLAASVAGLAALGLCGAGGCR
uniref:Uncharacterized protein n=1 Tax=Alexandrium andersonii TaxID=327968 RepID=A0A7S2D6F7_9DINO|mmetsp:Transcript_48086/g.108965  ORF Transcript_48086/g.108965 Transcript_48086/m.108965 type:complete len:151 (+) Transcript_48086:44-496(+)